jgi:hypothetical protein
VLTRGPALEITYVLPENAYSLIFWIFFAEVVILEFPVIPAAKPTA